MYISRLLQIFLNLPEGLGVAVVRARASPALVPFRPSGKPPSPLGCSGPGSGSPVPWIESRRLLARRFLLRRQQVEEH